MKNINNFLSIKDAAKMVGVCKRTLMNWEKRGKMKVLRNPLNNYRLYCKKDLIKFLTVFNVKNNKKLISRSSYEKSN